VVSITLSEGANALKNTLSLKSYFCGFTKPLGNLRIGGDVVNGGLVLVVIVDKVGNVLPVVDVYVVRNGVVNVVDVDVVEILVVEEEVNGAPVLLDEVLVGCVVVDLVIVELGDVAMEVVDLVIVELGAVAIEAVELVARVLELVDAGAAVEVMGLVSGGDVVSIISGIQLLGRPTKPLSRPTVNTTLMLPTMIA
jgi:hypothetical protein